MAIRTRTGNMEVKIIGISAYDDNTVLVENISDPTWRRVRFIGELIADNGFAEILDAYKGVPVSGAIYPTK